MIVTMVAVRMVEMAVDEVVRVIAMRYGFMAAPWPMHVGRVVSATSVLWCATIRVGV